MVGCEHNAAIGGLMALVDALIEFLDQVRLNKRSETFILKGRRQVQSGTFSAILLLFLKPMTGKQTNEHIKSKVGEHTTRGITSNTQLNILNNSSTPTYKFSASVLKINFSSQSSSSSSKSSKEFK